MDYAKSGDQGIGVVIEHREWVEGTEIGYWILNIGVGTGSNNITLPVFGSGKNILKWQEEKHSFII